MESKDSSGCSLHGPGVRPDHMVGRRLDGVVASWHLYGSEAPSGPLDVWLIDSAGIATHVTTGSDWCLIVESSPPFEGYDMAELGRVEVAPVRTGTPFASHIGEVVLAVREEEDPDLGRLALGITFESGRVRCDVRAGDLRLSGESRSAEIPGAVGAVTACSSGPEPSRSVGDGPVGEGTATADRNAPPSRRG
ncbi:hypothetical protein ACFWOY_14675 [Streptomyces sp. NPDC058423]|uniref:hypothetical protein n=1 Tax=unclassified Streptomyces TaxID=2593676 RepID=UPI003651E3A1